MLKLNSTEKITGTEVASQLALKQILFCLAMVIASITLEQGRSVPFFAVSLHLYEVSFILATALFGASLGIFTALLTITGIIFLSSNPGNLSYIHVFLYPALCGFLSWRIKTVGHLDIVDAVRRFWWMFGIPVIILCNYPLLKVSLAAALLTLVGEAGSSFICALIVQVLFYSDKVIFSLEKVSPGLASRCHWTARQIGGILAIIAAALPAAVALQVLYSDPLQNKLSHTFEESAVKANYAKEILELNLNALSFHIEREFTENSDAPRLAPIFDKFAVLCQLIDVKRGRIFTKDSGCQANLSVTENSEIPRNSQSLVSLHQSQLKSGLFTVLLSPLTPKTEHFSINEDAEAISSGFIVSFKDIAYGKEQDGSASAAISNLDFDTVYKTQAIFESEPFVAKSQVLKDNSANIGSSVFSQSHLLSRLTETLTRDSDKPIELAFMSVSVTAITPLAAIASTHINSLALISLVIIIMASLISMFADYIGSQLLTKIADYKTSLLNWTPGEPYSAHNSDSIAEDFNELSDFISSHMERMNTQIQQLEDARSDIEESEKKQRAVFEVIEQPIFVTTASLEIISKNSSAKTFLAENPSFLDSFPLTDDSKTKDVTVSQCIVHSAISGQSIQKFNWISNKKGSEGRSYLLSIKPAKLAGFHAAVVVLEDVTTFDLQRRSLAHADRLATLGELTTGVAHEINQPLNTIKLVSANLENRIGGLDIASTDKTYLETKIQKVVKQVHRAGKIVSSLKTFGRDIPEEKLILSTQKIVDNSLDVIGEQLRNTGIAVRHRALAKSMHIKASFLSIEQVIINVLNNARDSILEQGISQATIDIDEQVDDSFFILHIINPSESVPEEVRQKIFDPFFTTKEVGKGTGLGMSISYGIITDHGGAITFNNVAGGVCVSISLPLYQEKNDIEGSLS